MDEGPWVSLPADIVFTKNVHSVIECRHYNSKKIFMRGHVHIMYRFAQRRNTLDTFVADVFLLAIKLALSMCYSFSVAIAAHGFTRGRSHQEGPATEVASPVLYRSPPAGFFGGMWPR